MGGIRRDNWNTKSAIAILTENLGRRKRKEAGVTAMADATRFLTRKYGSYELVAKELSKEMALPVSAEMIRNFCDISSLDRRTRDLVDDGKIGIDVARRLYRIRDVPRRIETAKIVVNLKSFTSRAIIDDVFQHPELSVEMCKRRVLDKAGADKVISFVVNLESKEYATLRRFAHKKGVTAQKLARRILVQGLEKSFC